MTGGKLTTDQRRMLDGIRHQIKTRPSNPAYIETGRFKGASILTLKSLARRGFVDYYGHDGVYWVSLK